jgi:cytochrome c2
VCIFALLTAAASGCAQRREARTEVEAGISRGRSAVARYGCDACHAIDKPTPATTRINAATLDGIATRSYIAGVLPNTPANLARWIIQPRLIRPHTIMPALGVSETDARDIAAYLYSLK